MKSYKIYDIIFKLKLREKAINKLGGIE